MDEAGLVGLARLARETGNGDGEIGTAVRQRALGHGNRHFAADHAVPRDEARFDAEQLRLGFLGIGNESTLVGAAKTFDIGTQRSQQAAEGPGEEEGAGAGVHALAGDVGEDDFEGAAAVGAGRDDEVTGERLAALWFWLFPSTMLSVYPWGASINAVQPLAVDRTRVKFLQYVWDPSKLEASAGNAIDRVEREDEAVVESVQRGIRSRLYTAGRYSPKRETGVHQFHRLLADALAD